MPLRPLPVQFSEMHEQSGRSILLTAQQEQWMTIQRMIASTGKHQGGAGGGGGGGGRPSPLMIHAQWTDYHPS